MTATIGWVISKSYASGFVEFLCLKEDEISWSGAASNATLIKDQGKAKEIVGNLKDYKEVEILRVEVAY